MIVKESVWGSIGRGLWKGTKLLANNVVAPMGGVGLAATKAVAKPIGKGINYGAGKFTKSLKAKPVATSLTTVGGAGTVALTAPDIMTYASGDAHNNLIAAMKRNRLGETAMFGAKQGSVDEHKELKKVAELREKIAIMKQLGAAGLKMGDKLKGVPMSTKALMLGLGGASIYAAPKVFGPTLDSWGRSLQRTFTTDATQSLNKAEMEAEEEAKAHAKTLGTESAKDVISNQTSQRKSLQETQELAPLRENILLGLKDVDPVINKGSNTPVGARIINDTMRTLSMFAPSLSTDKQTVQSVLREALTSSQGGLSYQTIKNLADTQLSVNRTQETKY